MSFRINEFLSNIESRGGVARQAHFDMVITPPPDLLRNVISQKDLTMRIESTSIPGRGIQTLNSRYWGPNRKIAYQVSHHDFPIRVLCSADLRERDFFLAWQDLILGDYRDTFAFTPRFDIGYYDDYANSSIVINQYEPSDEYRPVKVMTLKEAYPVNVNQMDADWGLNGVHRLNVTMASRIFIEPRPQEYIT